jgi:GT2 family glycosyltransferase
MTTNVHAVVLSHDQPETIQRVLDQLSKQTVAPTSVHIVDTSKHSTISGQGFEPIKLPPKTNFAQAIDAAVQKLPKDGYLWILHDDSAPDADALEKLLHEVELSPSLAVVGPKQVDWDNPKIIRQLGLTLTNSGRLFSPIRGAFDQGQHDRAEDVLAVGTAGALVNLAVYHDLEGFDGSAPALAADVDFSIRARLQGSRVSVAPAARVSHQMLSMQGGRSRSWLKGSPATAVRRAEIHLLLSYANPLAFLFGWLLLLPIAIANSAILLFRQKSQDVSAELASAIGAFFGIVSIASSRAKIRRTTNGKISTLSALRATRQEVKQERQRARDQEVSSQLLSAHARGAGDQVQLSASAGIISSGAIWWSLVLVLLNLAWLPTNVAATGAGVIPLSSNWLEIFSQAGSTSHNIGLSFSGASDPFVWALALLSAPVFFQPNLAIVLLLFFATPIAFLGVFKLSGLVTSKTVVRMLAAASFALWPALTNSLQETRFAQVVAITFLPWLLYSIARIAQVGNSDPSQFGRSHTGIAAILLAVIAASSPVLGVVLLTGLLVLGITRPARLGALLMTSVLTLVWFAPIVLERIGSANWLTSLLDPGVTVTGSLAQNWTLALFGFGLDSLALGLFITIPVLGLALMALLAPNPKVSISLWAVALFALGLSWVLLGVEFDLGNQAVVGVDVSSLLGLYGLALALLVAHLANSSKLLRVVSIGSIAILGVLPAAVALAINPPAISYSDDRVVPSIIQADVSGGVFWRTLQLESRPETGLVAQVFSGDGVHLEELATGYKVAGATDRFASPDYQELGILVANLASANGAEIFASLEKFGIGYILLSPENREVQLALDSTTELESIGDTDFGQLWKVSGITPQQTQPGIDLGLFKLGQLAVLGFFLLLAIPSRSITRSNTKDSEIFVDGEENN